MLYSIYINGYVWLNFIYIVRTTYLLVIFKLRMNNFKVTYWNILSLWGLFQKDIFLVSTKKFLDSSLGSFVNISQNFTPSYYCVMFFIPCNESSKVLLFYYHFHENEAATNEQLLISLKEIKQTWSLDFTDKIWHVPNTGI